MSSGKANNATPTARRLRIVIVLLCLATCSDEARQGWFGHLRSAEDTVINLHLETLINHFYTAIFNSSGQFAYYCSDCSREDRELRLDIPNLGNSTVRSARHLPVNLVFKQGSFQEKETGHPSWTMGLSRQWQRITTVRVIPRKDRECKSRLQMRGAHASPASPRPSAPTGKLMGGLYCRTQWFPGP
jgi:hypothetical protein